MILVLTRLKVPLAAAILAGAAALGVLFGLGPGKLTAALLLGAVEPMTLCLVLIVIILLILSQLLKEAGQLERIVALTGAALRRPALAMAALPAIIGLIPMPGGALFSAPMVKSAAGEAETAGGKLSAVNYWFRHVWEFWWPLYPGVLLAVSVSGQADPKIDMGRFILFNLPLSAFMIAAGLLIMRRVHPQLRVSGPPADRGTKRRLLAAAAPIWGVLLVWAAAKIIMRTTLGAPPKQTLGGDELTGVQVLMATLDKFLPLTVGLLAALAWTIISNRLGVARVGKVLKSARIYKLALLVLCVMIFQYVLKDVGAPARIRDELNRLRVPMEAVVMLLPFIAGVVTGLAAGFVGTSFPIVLGLVAASPGHGAIEPYVVLGYAFGHMGQMLSPLHLCHVVSNRFFKTAYGPVYRQILPSILVTGILAAAYFVLLRLIMT